MPKHKSSSDVSSGVEGYMPGMTQEKKKRGFMSLFKKKNKFKPSSDISYSSYPSNSSTLSRGTTSTYASSAAYPAAAGAASHNHHQRPQPSTSAAASNQAASATQQRKKKRQAPAPPPVRAVGAEQGALQVAVTHSRHSSHSSGFDESLESPGNSSRESDKTNKTKTSLDATSIESSDHELHAGKLQVVCSAPGQTTSVQGDSSAPSSTSGTLPRKSNKRRSAPPPPPATASSTVIVASPTISEDPSCQEEETIVSSPPDVAVAAAGDTGNEDSEDRPDEEVFDAPSEDAHLVSEDMKMALVTELKQESVNSDVSLEQVNNAFDQALDIDRTEMNEMVNGRKTSSSSDSSADSSSAHYEVNKQPSEQEVPGLDSGVVLVRQISISDHQSAQDVSKHVTVVKVDDDNLVSPDQDSGRSSAAASELTEFRHEDKVALTTSEEISLDADEVEYVSPETSVGLNKDKSVDPPKEENPSEMYKRVRSNSVTSEDGFELSDYRIKALTKEEIVDFQFQNSSRPITRKLSEKGENEPVVTSLRQALRRPASNMNEDVFDPMEDEEIRRMLRSNSMSEDNATSPSSSVGSPPGDKYPTIEENNNLPSGYRNIGSKTIYRASIDEGVTSRPPLSRSTSKEAGRPFERRISQDKPVLERQESQDGVSTERRLSESTKPQGRRLNLMGPRPWIVYRAKSEPNVKEISVALDNYKPVEKENQARLEARRLSALTGPQGYSARPRTTARPASMRRASELPAAKSRDDVDLNVSPTRTVQRRSSLRAPAQENENSGKKELSKEELQVAYNQLQDQFNNWQKQLMENQALLARKNASEEMTRVQHNPVEMTKPDALAPNKVPSPQAEDWKSKAASVKRPDASWEPPKRNKEPEPLPGRPTAFELTGAKGKLRQVKSESDGSVFAPTLGRVLDSSPLKPEDAALNRSIHHNDSKPREGSPHHSKRLLSTPASSTPASKPPNSKYEPQLDTREELMLAIRNASGRSNLRKVPVSQTRWHYGD